jgi:hypothetical protein
LAAASAASASLIALAIRPTEKGLHWFAVIAAFSPLATVAMMPSRVLVYCGSK